MKLRYLSLLSFLIPFSSALGAPGFHRVESPAVPEAVRQASKSVFKILSQAGGADGILHMGSSKEVFDRVRFDLASDEQGWKKSQFEYCERNRNKYCIFFPRMSEGSAFLMGDSASLYTSFRIFSEILSAQIFIQDIKITKQVKSQLANEPLFMDLMNQNFESVFDLRAQSARLELFNPEVELYSKTDERLGTPLGRLSNIVRLKLENPVSIPALRWAVDQPKEGETVYLISFPSKTENRKILFGAEDSDGESMYVSSGKVVSTKKLMGKTNAGAVRLFERHMIFGDFDSDRGSGGGPIVNGRGEVVGIYVGHWEDPSTPGRRIGGGLKTFDSERLHQLWENLREWY